MSGEGQIPISNALQEAQVDSIAEVINRDPEGYQRQDRDRIIAALRADRERRQQAKAVAEAAGTTKRKSPSRAVKLTETSGKTSDEMGL